jgi:predicted nucleic acid-binding protein
MSVLLDTNILTRSAQPAHPMQKMALDAVSILKTRGEDLCIVPQDLVEFWAVATRPMAVNGLAMTASQAQAELTRFKSFFRFLPDSSLVHDEWEKLVVRHAVSGKNTYDARMVAAMKVHSIGELLTFNGADFKRYPDITVIAPANVQ